MTTTELSETSATASRKVAATKLPGVPRHRSFVVGVVAPQTR
jgi:hypothetical protein